MNDLVIVGLSHRTAPVELRERLSSTMSELEAEIAALRTGPVDEAVVLSTCNRVEVYATSRTVRDAARAVRSHLIARAGDPLESAVYEHHGTEAVRHAFRVASSLDSLVVGEPQILGQVKASFEVAQATGSVGPLLGRCFARAFAVAKRVRTETGIAAGTVSISSIAVELARKIFGDLEGRRVLLVGAGEMGEAAAKALGQTGATLRVVNRSPDKALALAAACAGEARPYDALEAELVKADVVICSTSSHGFVLTDALIRDVVRTRRHRPLFLIDIAVPRDVDPRVAALDGVFLYDVDDLQKVAEDNLRSRKTEAEAAERIISVEVAEFEMWRRSLEVAPTIVALREHFLSVVRAEVVRSAAKLGPLDPDAARTLEKMSESIVNKLLHAPLTALKSAPDQTDQTALVASSRRLFDLDRQTPEAESAQVSESPQSPHPVSNLRKSGERA